MNMTDDLGTMTDNMTAVDGTLGNDAALANDAALVNEAAATDAPVNEAAVTATRSDGRRVEKECISRWRFPCAQYHKKNHNNITNTTENQQQAQPTIITH